MEGKYENERHWPWTNNEIWTLRHRTSNRQQQRRLPTEIFSADQSTQKLKIREIEMEGSRVQLASLREIEPNVKLECVSRVCYLGE